MRSVLKIGHKDFGCWIKDFNEVGSENWTQRFWIKDFNEVASENWTQRFGFWIEDLNEVGSESFNQNCFLKNLRNFGFRILHPKHLEYCMVPPIHLPT